MVQFVVLKTTFGFWFWLILFIFVESLEFPVLARFFELGLGWVGLGGDLVHQF